MPYVHVHHKSPPPPPCITWIEPETFAPFSYPMFPFLIEVPQLNTAIQPQVIKINVIMAKALVYRCNILYTHNTHNELRRRRIWYSTCIKSSTTLQISASLHKLIPVHPTGHMLRVHIFDVGETNASSRCNIL